MDDASGVSCVYQNFPLCGSPFGACAVAVVGRRCLNSTSLVCAPGVGWLLSRQSAYCAAAVHVVVMTVTMRVLAAVCVLAALGLASAEVCSSWDAAVPLGEGCVPPRWLCGPLTLRLFRRRDRW